MQTLKDDAVLRSPIQQGVLLLVVFNAAQLASRRRDLLEALGPGLELRNENRPSNFVMADSLFQLKVSHKSDTIRVVKRKVTVCLLQDEINRLSQTILDTIQEVMDHHSEVRLLDPSEPAPLVSRWREVVRHCFKLGFEFHKDALRLISSKPDSQLSLNVIRLAQQWMSFITTHCERGRGKRPKWAAQGLDFLVTVCDTEITARLTDKDFHKLKETIGSSVCHVIGVVDPPLTPNGSSSYPILTPLKSNPNSPAVRRFSRTSGKSSAVIPVTILSKCNLFSLIFRSPVFKLPFIRSQSLALLQSEAVEEEF